MIKLILLILVSICFANENSPFSSVQRQAYVEKVIKAFREANPNVLKQINEFVDQKERQKCRSFFEALTLNCLQLEVKNKCKDETCTILSDIALVNKVNERLFVSREETYKISQKSENYAEAYAKALSTKYANLTTELVLMSKENCSDGDYKCQARKIDTYCQKNSDKKNLPWQACVSAVITFMDMKR